MANTQTSVPLFVANTILTAAQQNISAATGVPVFATTATRDAAFGGSNKALAEGQMCYVEAAPNQFWVYDGADWRPFNTDTWGTYTPTVTASTGTITTASATGSFAYMGKTIVLTFAITITTNGTGATSLLITLPVNCSATYTNNTAIGVARKTVPGTMCQVVTQGTTQLAIFTYDNVYPGANGIVVLGTCTYQSA